VPPVTSMRISIDTNFTNYVELHERELHARPNKNIRIVYHNRSFGREL